MIDVVFDGKSLTDFNTLIFPVNADTRAERRYRETDIEGHNGSYQTDLKTYKNVDNHSYALFFIGSDIETDMGNLTDYLTSKSGYQRLEDSLHTDEFMMAKVLTDFSPVYTNRRNKARITLQFSRKPQRYLKIGERSVEVLPNSSIILRNPTTQDARPLIQITGIGKFTVNGVEYQVTENAGNLVIDSELMDCYEKVNGEWVVRNGAVNMPSTFPVLKAGENVITTLAQTLKITPRWWHL